MAYHLAELMRLGEGEKKGRRGGSRHG
jgi:hypothetical protein